MSKGNSIGTKRTRWLIASIVVCLLAAACAVEPSGGPGGANGSAAPASRRAEPGGASAAADYERLAASAAVEARAGYWIAAAKAHLDAHELGAARRALTAATATATASEHAEITVLEAELTLVQGDPNSALATLATIPGGGEIALQTEIARVRGRALFALGRYEDAVRVLVDREVWLDTGPEILANQALIWQGLTSYPNDTPPPPTGDSIVDGWLALAPIAAANTDSATLKSALITWREHFPDHPAAGAYLADLLATRRGPQDFPSQIALLLPLGSAQRAAAAALRDGFITGYLADGRPQVEIRVYDTTQLGAGEAYLRAQLEGADFIVGPLLRPEVEQIAQQVGFVPTLALNFLPDGASGGPSFFQFGLLPEDEAREIARHAAARGATTALALVPGDALGRRLLASFQSEFEALGGRVLAVASYDPGGRDFSQPITSLLNLGASTQRYRRLAANLGVSLQFEPRRRTDADMLFVAASAATGRLIAPQLRFYYAGDIPTYATSNIYEPSDTRADNDLNGLYFADAPWLLEPGGEGAELQHALTSYWPQRSQWVRLFGMGFDAYSLIGKLFAHPTTLSMNGVSGELEMDAAQQIHRRLPLAQFRDGRPVAVEDSPPPETPLGLAQRE